MPTVGISIARLRRLIAADVDDAQLETLLDQLGCDVEGIVDVYHYVSVDGSRTEILKGESLPLTDPYTGRQAASAAELWTLERQESVIRLELLPVRPDLFDAGGLARAIRGYLGLETGLPVYEPVPPGPIATGLADRWRVEVDPRLADPAFRRPHIQCAVIRGLSMDEELLRAIMRLQEHLHWALARDRRFASIGVYDLASLKNPISYTLVDRESFRFTPLFFTHRGPVSPAQMLAEHPKGAAYAHLVEGMELLPALIDAAGSVLSLPPVINADETKVTSTTRDLLIDVTGSNLPAVTRALSIMATSLLELAGGGEARLEQVEIVHSGAAGEQQAELTPALQTPHFTLDPERAARLIGVPLTREKCRELLLKMRFGVHDPGHGPLEVAVPPYRSDILHEVDLIEDIAIAYGYHHIKPELVPTFTAGRTLKLNDRARTAAAALTGLGFTETVTLVLTSERDHYEKLRREPPARRVVLENPVSQDQTMLREHLYSSLLEVLQLNCDFPLPQRIFEVGNVVRYFADLGSEAPVDGAVPRELRVVAGALCATRAGYADGRSLLDSLLAEMGHSLSADLGASVDYRADDNPSALPGRAAAVYDEQSRRIAEVFEVHPEVLEAWRLENPVVLFSLLLGVNTLSS